MMHADEPTPPNVKVVVLRGAQGRRRQRELKLSRLLLMHHNLNSVSQLMMR